LRYAVLLGFEYVFSKQASIVLLINDIENYYKFNFFRKKLLE
jgi:hypothetical protein